MERYEKYKPSGVEWIGEIPQGWKVQKLKHTFKFQTGFTPATGNQEYYDNGDNIWITISDMTKRIVSDSSQKITLEAITNHNINITPKGSLLYSFKLSVGKVAFAGKDCYTNEAIFSILPTLGLILDFYYYSLPSQVIMNANENIYGAKLLNQDLIKNANIIIPPFEEQQAIAEYLDEKCGAIDALIERKERLLELYAEKRQAIINRAVTRGIDPNAPLKDSGIPYLGQIPAHWEVKKLKYIVKVNPIKDIGIDKKTDECITFLPMEKVSENGNIDCEIKKPINDLSSGFTFFRKNDILIAKITPCFENGKGALLDKLDTEFGFGSTEFHVIRCGEKVCEKFIFYIIKSSIFMNLGEAMMTGSAGQKRVPTIFIENYLLGVPTLSEQTTIVKYIEEKCGKIDQICEKLRQQIDLYREYRTALIANAVTGKIKI